MPTLVSSFPWIMGSLGLIALAALLFYGSRSPIFWIDLVTTARRPRYLLVRVVYALLLLFVLYTSYESTVARSYFMGDGTGATLQMMAQFAQTFFHQFAWLQLFAITILTPALVAGTIATEREGKTIEYLFTTDLSDSEIVLGKLATRVAHLLSFMLVALPVLALASLFGGISGDRLLQAFALSGSMLCSTAGLSLAMSIRARRARDAVVGTYLVLLAVLLVPPSLFGIVKYLNMQWGGRLSYIEDIFTLTLSAHPYFVLIEDLQSTFSGAGSDWTNIVILMGWHALFTVVLVGLAVWGVRRVHVRDVSAGEKKRSRRFQWLRPPIGENPLLWKELFAESWRLGIGSYIALAFLLGVALFFMGMGAIDASGQQFAGMVGGMSTFIVCVTMLIVSARAAMSVTGEHERDTWLSLISTPVTAHEVVFSKVMGSLYSVRMIGVYLGGLWFLAVIRHPQALVSLGLHTFTTLLVALFCGNVGVFFSLASRTSMRAMAGTLGVIVFLGGFYLCCCTPIAAMSRGGREMEVMFAPCLAFLVGASAFLGELTAPSEMVGVYVVGMVMYTIATGVLYSVNVGRFEQLAGRTVQR